MADHLTVALLILAQVLVVGVLILAMAMLGTTHQRVVRVLTESMEDGRTNQDRWKAFLVRELRHNEE
ncbi:MAG: hypothetical protein ABSH29_26475 [Acidimicrobiales bacterium]